MKNLIALLLLSQISYTEYTNAIVMNAAPINGTQPAQALAGQKQAAELDEDEEDSEDDDDDSEFDDDSEYDSEDDEGEGEDKKKAHLGDTKNKTAQAQAEPAANKTAALAAPAAANKTAAAQGPAAATNKTASLAAPTNTTKPDTSMFLRDEEDNVNVQEEGEESEGESDSEDDSEDDLDDQFESDSDMEDEDGNPVNGDKKEGASLAEPAKNGTQALGDEKEPAKKPDTSMFLEFN